MKIRIGLGSCGIAAGAKKVKQAVEQEITAAGLDLTVQQTGCIGMCYNEPLLDILEDDGTTYTYGHVTEQMVKTIFEEHLKKGRPVEKYLVATEKPNDFLSGQVRVALRNCGLIDPEQITDYTDRGGYKALKQVINLTDLKVIEEIKISGLRGRGGAGFPTWFKWNAARQNQGDIKYIVCNADEGDPGAFMDRSVLEGDPHSVLEGMAIAGYAIGAGEGIIYARAEYPLAIHRVQIAIDQARA